MMSGLERKADMAAKVAKLKTELIFADAKARKSAALKEHEEELKKLKLTKKLALAKAEMDAVSKVEESEFGDLQEVLPTTTDKGDLLQKYLSTQVESVTGTSLTTLQTDVEFTPDPTEIVENGKPDNEHESSPEIIRSPPSASQKEPVVTASLYPTLNPFAPEYMAVSTPKFVPTSRLPFPQDQTAGPRKTAPVPKQDGNFCPLRLLKRECSSAIGGPTISEAFTRFATITGAGNFQGRSLVIPVLAKVISNNHRRSNRQALSKTVLPRKVYSR